MNKRDFTKIMTSKLEVKTAKEGKEITDLFIETIKDIITSGESLEIAGFGTFKTVDLAPRTSRNPRTGEAIKVPSRKRIKFKTSIQLEVKENA